MRSWLDYSKDPISNRATVTRQRTVMPRRIGTGTGRPLYAKPPQSETYEAPYISPEEIAGRITERFNKLQPRTRRRGDYLEVSRSMPKPEMPSEMAGDRRYSHLFGEGTLDTTYTIPAPTGERFQSFDVPPSDYERQMGYLMGISGAGGPRAAMINPSHVPWPSSSFNVPMRPGTLGAEPVFGANVDYTKGTWTAPPVPFGRTAHYGRFAGTKPPELPEVRRPSSRQINYARSRLDWKKQQRKREDILP